jgi:very-short-patch-repair endonuclease
VLEARLLRVIRRHRTLPEPVAQYEVREQGRFVARVDFAYPERKIAIEADGYRWHSDAARWRRDLSRRNELTRAGWLVLHFTWADVSSRPRDVAATILAAISRASVPESGTEARMKARGVT